jgi:uncharacterized protein involved in exopolysaccharide biosynthesis
MSQFEDAYRIIKARRIAVFAVLIVGLVAALIGLKLAHPTYAATATVLMNAGSSQGSTTISDGGFLGTDMPALLLSDTVLTRFAQQEHLQNPSFKDLRKAIDAEIMPESAVMPITYKSRYAKGAIDGANALAYDLRDYYREISTRRYDDLAAYLSSALDGERVKIEKADRQIAHLVASDPYFTQSDAAQAIGAQMLALDQQRDQIDATLQSHEIEAQLAGQRMTEMRPTVLSELRANNTNYQSLAQQVAKDRTAEAVLEAQYTGHYDGIKSLQDQITRSNAVLETERKRAEAEDPGNSATYGSLLTARDQAASIYAGDQAQLAAIESQIEQAETHLSKLPQVGVKIASLRRDRDAATTAYQILAEQRTLTLSQQAQTAALSSITVTDPASVAEPSVGKGALLLPIAAMLAFTLLALALPFGLELIDQRLRRRETIEQLYGRPLIGTVPA